jgi:hypothetical protein
MWSAISDFIAEKRQRATAVSDTLLSHALCLLTDKLPPAGPYPDEDP